MKQLCLIPLIVILTACASSPTSAPPTPKIEAATIAPATKTPIPTNTIEPTPTPDPSIPDGYIKDASGNYTKSENGFIITWDAERKAGYSLMFDDFLWDLGPEVENGFPDQVELKVYIDSAIQNWNKLTITHKENMDSAMTVNWSSVYFSFMLQEMGWRNLIDNSSNSPNNFSFKTWQNPGYIIHYKTKEGPQILVLGEGRGTTVHIRADYDALKADMENNNFTEAVGSPNLGSPSIIYMVKISSDADGNTFVEMAPNITDALQWKDQRIIEMFLFGYSAALGIPDEILIPRVTSFSTDLAKNHASYPYFIFTRQK